MLGSRNIRNATSVGNNYDTCNTQCDISLIVNHNLTTSLLSELIISKNFILYLGNSQLQHYIQIFIKK